MLVGYFMMRLVRDIEWSDPGIGIPALLTISVMPFTYSITNGVGVGFLAYVVIAGAARQCRRRCTRSSTSWRAMFAWYFVRGLLEVGERAGRSLEAQRRGDVETGVAASRGPRRHPAHGHGPSACHPPSIRKAARVSS